MQERVTRQEMLDIRIGQTCIFTLADKKKIMLACVQANMPKKPSMNIEIIDKSKIIA